MRRCRKCGSSELIPISPARVEVVNTESGEEITYTEFDLVCIDCGTAHLEAYI